MNHSEAAIIRNFAKQELSYIYNAISSARRRAARLWDVCEPGLPLTFEDMNNARDYLRDLQRERRAWESLMRLLKEEILHEQIMHSLRMECSEEITDDDYGTLDNNPSEWDNLSEMEEATEKWLNSRGW